MSDKPASLNDEEFQKFAMKIITAGHEVVTERACFRHKGYRKDFPKGTLIKIEGVPYITEFGAILRTDDVFPERADLCLDIDGNVVSQQEFERRYLDYLGWFGRPEGSEVELEPIPSVTDFLSKTYDVFGESGSMVTIGYDAKKPAETVPTHQYDPRNDKMVEIEANQKMMVEILAKLAEQSERRGPGRPPKEA